MTAGCRACRVTDRSLRRRGLCRRCYYRPEVRVRFPAVRLRRLGGWKCRGACRHCRRVRFLQARGLCSRCYADRGVRELYPRAGDRCRFRSAGQREWSRGGVTDGAGGVPVLPDAPRGA